MKAINLIITHVDVDNIEVYVDGITMQFSSHRDMLKSIMYDYSMNREQALKIFFDAMDNYTAKLNRQFKDNLYQAMKSLGA